jgi:hypothetical protein
MRRDLDWISPKAFCLVCMVCGGQIIRARVGDNPNTLQWRCNQCHKEFGPVWNRLIWGDKPSLKLVGPKPWSAARPQIALQIARVVLSYILSYAVTLAGLLL